MLTQFEFTGLASMLLSVAAILLFGYLLKDVQDTKLVVKAKLKVTVLFIRAFAAAAIVLCITALAQFIGANWSGVLSAFPITLFPFLLIIHLTYGSQQVHTIIKHYPYGLGALLVYGLCIVALYPKVGLLIGTVWAFIAATLYLLLFAWLQQLVQRKKAADRRAQLD